MFVFPKDTLVQVLSHHAGVSVVSYGKPRDGFELPVEVPLWTSGYGGKYETKHTNVPKGVMIAVGDLEGLDVTNQDALKAQLKNIDIYPTGGSGDFTGKNLGELVKWFSDRSRRDDEVNSQTPIAHAKKLTPEGLGRERYDDLVNYLSDNMTILKEPKTETLIPADRIHRKKIVEGILNGLSKTVRYTRLDDPAEAFQITEGVEVDKGGDSTIVLGLTEPAKMLLLRRNKNSERDITPFDRAMLGRTWVTADNNPLGNRGSIDASQIAIEADAIQHGGRPTTTLPYNATTTLMTEGTMGLFSMITKPLSWLFRGSKLVRGGVYGAAFYGVSKMLKGLVDIFLKFYPENELLAKASTILNEVCGAEDKLLGGAEALVKEGYAAIPKAEAAEVSNKTEAALPRITPPYACGSGAAGRQPHPTLPQRDVKLYIQAPRDRRGLALMIDCDRYELRELSEPQKG
jgi:hypothetical protein